LTDETVVIVSGEVFISTEKGEERWLGPSDMLVVPLSDPREVGLE